MLLGFQGVAAAHIRQTHWHDRHARQPARMQGLVVLGFQGLLPLTSARPTGTIGTLGSLRACKALSVVAIMSAPVIDSRLQYSKALNKHSGQRDDIAFGPAPAHPSCHCSLRQARGTRALQAEVERLDGGVVPARDVALEDGRQHHRRQAQLPDFP